MGVFNGQAVSAVITNPAFINKNTNDVMPNILGFARALSGASIADIQATANKLYTATGASESQSGTVYNATPGTIANGDNYQTALTTLAGKFNPATGHFHTGAAGDGPILPVVLDVAVTGGTPVNGHITFTAGMNVLITQIGTNFIFAASGGGGGGGGSVQTFNFVNNQSSFSDVTGFSIAPTGSHAFASEISIERTYVNVLTDQEDSGFYTNIAYSFDSLESQAGILSDGTIALGGNNSTVANNFVKLNFDGTTNSTFATNLGTGVNNTVSGIAVQANDSIIIAGDFTVYNGSSIKRVARVSATGILDTTFQSNIGTGPLFGGCYSAAIQADQKILVGGAFQAFDTSSAQAFVRLNTDGTVDSAFNTNLGTGFDGLPDSIFVQADQKILVGGHFTALNSVTVNGLVRLNTDGTIDTAFQTNLGTGFDNAVYSVIQQTDHKIVVAGQFTSFNGGSTARIVRLNSDGTLDTAFDTNVNGQFTAGIIYSVVEQTATQKLVLGGSFTSGVTNRLLRLNADGTADTAFATALGTNVNNTVHGVVVQPNGQIIVLGEFTSFNGFTKNRIFRFETTSDINLVSEQTVKGVYHTSTSGWTLALSSPVGDALGVSFQMTSAGQMQYTSTDIWPAGNQVMKFEIMGL